MLNPDENHKNDKTIINTITASLPMPQNKRKIVNTLEERIININKARSTKSQQTGTSTTHAVDSTIIPPTTLCQYPLLLPLQQHK